MNPIPRCNCHLLIHGSFDDIHSKQPDEPELKALPRGLPYRRDCLTEHFHCLHTKDPKQLSPYPFSSFYRLVINTFPFPSKHRKKVIKNSPVTHK
jgi:hypothetical protein